MEPAPQVVEQNRRLHIGGKVRAAGWEVLDAITNPWVDHVGDAADLSRFATDTFAALYASHVIEHFDYMGKAYATLCEWHRVLRPGGTLYLSAPDMDTLARLFVDRTNLDVHERFFVMRMMFGGHTDAYDFHYAGWNEEFLTPMLQKAGFARVRRVPGFGLFDDTSAMHFKGVPISLNLLAEKQ